MFISLHVCVNIDLVSLFWRILFSRKKKLFKRCCLQCSVRLATPSWLTGISLELKGTRRSIALKNPKWRETDLLAIYMHYLGVEPLFTDKQLKQSRFSVPGCHSARLPLCVKPSKIVNYIIRSPLLGACNSHNKPVQRHFYRPVQVQIFFSRNRPVPLYMSTLR